MNDFTKEELQLILKLSEPHEVGDYIKGMGALILKVQSMIDNYCEHDHSGGEVEEFLDTCSKCNAFMLREFHYDHQ